ncbi:putative mitochondrial protein AtMg00310 [Apium graveolens]|uniref:putative mitochondrial protein AtMg00310 n=1 Tax=Apium graveolens TaxID=4045 RepID=UPI003D7A8524
MGFRDFRDFNLAMLGNQVWRFLTKPNSLVSKVYKARYFLNENYLDSSAGHNPSFVWRSIWKAGDVVKAGVHWVVGSGEMINILGQPWLLDDHNPFITSDSPALANNKVSSIMSMEHRVG